MPKCELHQTNVAAVSTNCVAGCARCTGQRNRSVDQYVLPFRPASVPEWKHRNVTAACFRHPSMGAVLACVDRRRTLLRLTGLRAAARPQRVHLLAECLHRLDGRSVYLRGVHASDPVVRPSLGRGRKAIAGKASPSTSAPPVVFFAFGGDLPHLAEVPLLAPHLDCFSRQFTASPCRSSQISGPFSHTTCMVAWFDTGR